MATFPPAVSPTPPAGGPPSPGGPPPAGGPGAGPAGGGGGGAIKLAMLGQTIQALAKDFPAGQQGIKMMLDGLRMLQASASAASSPAPQPGPPR